MPEHRPDALLEWRRRPVPRRASASPRSASTLCFGRGEGLPGQRLGAGPADRAARSSSRLVLPSHREQAHAEGITCGIARADLRRRFRLPRCWSIFCGDDDDARRCDRALGQRRRSESARHDAWSTATTARTADTFEFISRRTSVPASGTGLPGPGLGGRRLPVVHARTSARSARFLRADSADQGRHQPRLRRAVRRCRGDAHLRARLPVGARPRRSRAGFEIWKPDAKREHLHLEGGFCEQGGRIVPAPSAPRPRPRPGHDRPGARDRRPGAQSTTAGAEPNGWGRPRRPSSASTSLLVMPIVDARPARRRRGVVLLSARRTVMRPAFAASAHQHLHAALVAVGELLEQRRAGPRWRASSARAPLGAGDLARGAATSGPGAARRSSSRARISGVLSGDRAQVRERLLEGRRGARQLGARGAARRRRRRTQAQQGLLGQPLRRACAGARRC